MQVVAH